MNKKLYRLLIKAVPKPRLRFGEWTGFSVPEEQAERLIRILERERAQGGVLALMAADGAISAAAFGVARFRDRQPARPDDCFRCASISKHVTAAGVLRLAAQGKIDPDRDISDYLSYAVRHPKTPETPITLRLLMAHRAGLRDGERYAALGAGLIGAVLEAVLNEPFEQIMRGAILDPAGVRASYLPQRVPGRLADAWRLMPPSRGPLYDAEARQQRSLPALDPEHDYLTAHGGLCTTAEDLLRIAAFVRADPACAAMRRPLSDFGKRDQHLQEGLGCFIYRDPALPFPLYGHQGLAYGAVHGLFYSDGAPAPYTAFALLTSAVSEQREGVVTAVNRDVGRTVFEGQLKKE